LMRFSRTNMPDEQPLWPGLVKANQHS
jgi:hypothetical protein